MRYRWLPLSILNDTVPIARDLGVSEVARSGRGFVAVYRRSGGDPDRVPDAWAEKRNNFIKRHMAQVNLRGEPLWEGGEPTRRHIALIMWAYSPTPERVEKWLDAVYGET